LSDDRFRVIELMIEPTVESLVESLPIDSFCLLLAVAAG